MPNLRSQLDELALDFATSVIAAIRSASLQDLLADAGGAGRARSARSAGRRAPGGGGGGQPDPRKTPRRRGRLARRSPAEIASVLGKVVSLLKGKKSGLRAEQIQSSLGLDRREMPRVLQTGLSKKQLRKHGQKRATVYFAK